MTESHWARTGQNPSMPPRSNHPGLKWRRTANRRQPYWVAKQVVRDLKGFPERTIRLPAGADEETLGELCRDHTARLLAWLAAPEGKRAVIYDGSIRSLSRLYQQHADSPFHDVKRNTRKTYCDSLKLIENTVGNRLVRAVTIIDVKRWFKLWRAPKVEGGTPRASRAHDAVSMLRTILRFGFALGYPDCANLVERLKMVRFENAGAREQEMTAAQAMAFIRVALSRGDNRGRNMAIGVAAQFELALRQKDIIGEWGPARANIAGATYDGAEMWMGPFRWENIPGWRFRLKTSKNRARAEFFLDDYPMLFPLLEAVPHAERNGAIVKGEYGLPIRERSYRKWFREIARAAGIPDEVWSMDSRAGAATEADAAGADLKSISDLLTHAEPRTTLRYIRSTQKRVREVAKARARAREALDNDA
jgi:Phage integrase family